jgi:hypothetical protein
VTNSGEIIEKQSLDHCVQKINPVQNDRVHSVNPVKNDYDCSCSSSYINIKTTTTNTEKIEKNFSEKIPLVFPVGLNAKEINLAKSNMAGIEPSLQQAILDEMAAKIQTQCKTSNPVRNPIGYLAWMCNAHRAGTAVLTSLGIRYAEKRENQAVLDLQAQEQKRQPMPDKKTVVQASATRRVDYADKIQALKDSLRSRKNSQADSATYPGQLGAMGLGGNAACFAV